jgi:hypothetical protein
MSKKTPEFAPGFEPTPAVDLDDPTIQQEAAALNAAAPPPPQAVSSGEVTTLVTALTALISQLQGSIGQAQTAAVLAEMGSKVLSVEKIDVPAYVTANVKGFDKAQHYKVVDEVRYPQMGDREPLVRTRGVTIETLNQLGIEV